MYSRYTTQDWDSSNKAHFSLSDHEKSLAERLRSDAMRAIKSTDATTRNRQAANTKKLCEFVIAAVALLAFLVFLIGKRTRHRQYVSSGLDFVVFVYLALIND